MLTYSSFGAAIEAMLQNAQKLKMEKISVLKLSTGLDKVKWLKVNTLITEILHRSVNIVTVNTQPEHENASPGETQKEKETMNEMHEAQEGDQRLSTIFSWFKMGNSPIVQSNKATQETLGLSRSTLTSSKS